MSASHTASLFETATGRWWLPDDVPTDIVIQAMRAGLVFEPEIIALAETYIRKGSIVLDIGSNFGQMAVIFSRLVGPEGTVHAFEADASTFELLQRNLRENECNNVVAHCGAVWREAGLSLFYPEPDFKRFGSFGSYGIDPNARSGRSVPSLTIDGLGIQGPVSFIKVDVQGSDLFALEGAAHLILRDKPAVVFEYEEQFQAEFCTNFGDYQRFIGDIGYQVEKVVGGINYLITPASGKLRVLLVSHRGERCGVHQFGRRLFETVQSGGQIDWRYVECGSMDEFLAGAAIFSPDAVVLNYHPATLAWVADARLKTCGVPCFAVFHEACQISADALDAGLFEYLLCPDPTLLPRNPLAVPVPRFIPCPRPAAAQRPGLFTVGSFGFATPGKGFERLCGLVNAEFDSARIRINIPPHDIGTLILPAALDALLAECRNRVSKPGITLEITHDFMDEETLLDFLSGNTINAFLYENAEQRGISSCIDYALASGRPVAVSGSSMFRNLHRVTPSISVEERSLREIAASGIAPLSHHIAQYAPKASSTAWNNAILEALELRRLCRSVPDGRGFNKILDDRSRLAYGRALDDLQLYAPDLLTRKIERANIQQAFALDAAERLIARYSEPRILAVGSFEDTTVAVLRAKGFRLDEVDPNVNQRDLGTFFESDDAIVQSYDVVLCVSVLEHVENDGRFVRTIADLLAPGGVAIFTVDFSNLYPLTGRKPAVDQRLYTTSDIRDRLMSVLPDCGLLDFPGWNDGVDEFTFDGCDYSFASWVFRKFNPQVLRHAIPDLIARRREGFATRMPPSLLDPLIGRGELYGSTGTVIGREEIEQATRVFRCDGEAQGYLLYGPYCACPSGQYECSFLVQAVPADIPPDTTIAVIDTAIEGVPQELHRAVAYSDLSPGIFSVVGFEFDVAEDSSQLETRLRLVYPIGLTVVASVAIRPKPS
jgi:FkbM family methyltransferase